jgi:iron complex outermembrane receptor protein
VSKQTFARLIDVNAAVRLSDYSTFGAESTLKAGARWRVNNDLLLRGGFGQGFRAPGIGELFGSNARFDQTLADPCSDMLGLNSGMAATPETCRPTVATSSSTSRSR